MMTFQAAKRRQQLMVACLLSPLIAATGFVETLFLGLTPAYAQGYLLPPLRGLRFR